jgi:hypothetical protein
MRRKIMMEELILIYFLFPSANSAGNFIVAIVDALSTSHHPLERRFLAMLACLIIRIFSLFF